MKSHRSPTYCLLNQVSWYLMRGWHCGVVVSLLWGLGQILVPQHSLWTKWGIAPSNCQNSQLIIHLFHLLLFCNDTLLVWYFIRRIFVQLPSNCQIHVAILLGPSDPFSLYRWAPICLWNFQLLDWLNNPPGINSGGEEKKEAQGGGEEGKLTRPLNNYCLTVWSTYH